MQIGLMSFLSNFKEKNLQNCALEFSGSLSRVTSGHDWVSVHHVTWHHKTAEGINWLLTFKKIYIWWQYSKYQSLVSSTRPPQNINHGVVFPVIAMHADRCFLLHSRIPVHFFYLFKKSHFFSLLQCRGSGSLHSRRTLSLLLNGGGGGEEKKIIFHRFLTDKTRAHRSSSLHTCSPLSP